MLIDNKGAELSENKYSRWYNALIAKAKSRDSLTGYVEKHHIIPRCMGGSNEESNIATLTYREHFIVHWLLSKFTTGQAKRKMQSAIGTMTRSKGGRTIAAWQYAKARRSNADASVGNKHTDESKAKMSKAHMGNKGALGIKHTDETKAKMSAAQIGRPRGKQTDEHRANISAAKIGINIGRKHTDETRAKMSASTTAFWIMRRATVAAENATVVLAANDNHERSELAMAA